MSAIKQKYSDKKIFVVFQPHQYSRTKELLPYFANAFSSADFVLIPNIYFSRDKKEDVEFMTTDKLVATISEFHKNVKNGNGLENSLAEILDYDGKNPNSSVIILLGAGDVDTLRDKIL